MSSVPDNTQQRGFLIGALTIIVHQAVRERVFAGFQDAGFGDLTPSHNTVFVFLKPEGDRIVDLAKRAGVTKQAMGYLVRHLENNGYLERVPHPTDGRAQIVRRTARGWEVNRLARQLVEEIQSEWADHLGQDRMDHLLSLLQELVRMIGIEFGGSTSEKAIKSEEMGPISSG